MRYQPLPVNSALLLQLTQNVNVVAFHIPETLAHSYTVQISGIAGLMRTHPSTFLYKGGKIDDMPLEVNLVVGVSYKIDTSKQLLGVVQRLYDMALPPPNTRLLESVDVAIGGWFRCKVFVSKISIQFQLPFNEQGEYTRCNVKLSLTPTGVGRTASITSFLKGGIFKTAGSLPGRNWKFNRQFGTGDSNVGSR